MLLWNLSSGLLEKRLPSGSQRARSWRVSGLRFSPDGTYLLGASEEKGRHRDDAALSLWDVASGELRRIVTHGFVGGFYVSSADGYLVTAGMDRTIRRWALDSLEELERANLPDYPCSLAPLSEGRFVLSYPNRPVVACWSVNPFRVTREHRRPPGRAVLGIATDSHWIVGSSYPEVLIWAHDLTEVRRVDYEVLGLKSMPIARSGTMRGGCWALLNRHEVCVIDVEREEHFLLPLPPALHPHALDMLHVEREEPATTTKEA